MKSAAKGLGLFLVVLVVVGAAAVWFLKDDDAARIESGRGPASESPRPEGTLAKPADLDPANPHSAERAEELRAAETAATAPAGATRPTAEYLSGVVVDRNGRPVANAEVFFGMGEYGRPFGRGRRMFRFGNTPESLPDGVRTRSASDGTFRLTKVPRVEAFSLRVDHPDFVIYERGELIVPSSGMELGRITLEPGAMVSGQVFGPGGAKVAGAEVSLRDVEDDDQTGFRMLAFSAGPRGGRKTTSDADGRFRLTGVPGGKAEVVATAKDMCEAVSEVVVLEPLQEKGGIVLHLERGHMLSGIVRDADAKPIEGARVSASTGDQFARFARMASGEGEVPTGADGRFTLTGLKAGLYEVSVDADGFASKSVDGVDAASGVPVEITLGASAYVAGVVRVKGSGELAKDVKVQLTPYWGEDSIAPPFEMPDAENRADSEAPGSFRVEDVEPGQYRVAARAEGTTRAYSAPITIEEGKGVDGLQIEVERGAVLTGRVVDAATGAPIEGAQVSGFADRDETEAPLSATPGGVRGREVRMATRMAVSTGGRRVSFGYFDRQSVGRAKTDAEGRYEIQHLSAGRVVVDVSHDEYATARSEPHEIEAGEVEQAGDLALGRGGGVEGNVVGIDGQPRPGDRIDVESRAIKGVTRSAVTDANGWYRIDHVPAGEAVATRSENDEGGAGPRMVFQAIMLTEDSEEGEKGKPIVVAEGEVLRLDFSQVEKPYVEGIVTSADGPVAGALVSVMSDMQGGMPLMLGAQKEVTTGPDGRYRIADLDPGTLRISARHPLGIVPTVANVTLASGSPARQDFLLEGGVIEGDVVAQGDGKSRLEGAVVTLERIQENEGSGGTAEIRGEFTFAVSGTRRGGPMRQIRFGGGTDVRVSTDRNGHYRVPWVPAGKYRVSVSRSEYLDSRSDELVMPANGHLDGVNVAMPPAARLRVQLKSKATGLPLGSCPVQLQGEEGGSQHGFTDAEGVATFDSLRPGTWTAIGKKSWQDPDDQRQSVTCEAGQLATITIDL